MTASDRTPLPRSPRIVLFEFAGRRANMEVQLPYLARLLDTYPGMEVHLWDLTREVKDQLFIQGLAGAFDERVRLIDHLHPGHPIRCINPLSRPGRRFRCPCIRHRPPYEQPYRWYAEREEYADTVFVKVDDDVLFLETERFADLIEPLAEHPNRVISANVVNNSVCAKYEPDLVSTFAGHLDAPHDVIHDRRWWEFHTNPDFARASHDWFLDNYMGMSGAIPLAMMRSPEHKYVRTRPGEAVSINCIAFTHRTMRRLAAGFHHDPRLGDEGAVDKMLPWIARTFHAAHLAFGPQEKAMTTAELNALRERYTILSKGYLE